MIDIHFEDVDPVSLQIRSISKWIERIIESESCIQGELCYIFCSDKYLLDINKKFLNHDYYTDIITFDYSENGIISGDIFVSIERISDNSKQYEVSFDYELLRIVVHGVLHLLGYKDKNEKEKIKMTFMENSCLKLFEDVEGI
ncbi:MAG: rRNA maturation RNase YbeY [Salinivirgaceae bacterium]|jgi:probable rRNA maturation factor|nr:rRNA maturation RNase YbeY [Salinivirgaceae bacterium]